MGSCLSADGAASPPSPVSPAKRQRRGGRRRAVGKGDSVELLGPEFLRGIPGRMFLNGASGIASLFTQQGKKGTNQDAMIVWENFGSKTDTVFCGVFDGHGPFGHIVARRVRDHLPLKLSAHWEVNISSEDHRGDNMSRAGSIHSDETVSVYPEEDAAVSVDLEEKKQLPEIFTSLKESFLKAFKVMDKELKLHPSIDCFCSGTTAVALVKQGQDLIIGNVGDSRAVLGTRDHNGIMVAVQLTVDLKPNLPREAERIRRCRGRVFALQDEPEVARVWLPNNDSPGLAMARAFGDFCLKDFGLISVPEVSYRRLTEKDEFIVLATDGNSLVAVTSWTEMVAKTLPNWSHTLDECSTWPGQIWDVLSNKEVIDIIASAPARSLAARLLVETAVRAWMFKYPTSKIDDCAVVCLFLDSGTSVTGSNHKSTAQGASTNTSDPVGLERSGTVRATGKPEDQEALKQPSNSNSSEDTPGDEEWSAMQGVSRVNTLLTLPRFVSGEEAGCRH